MWLDAHTHLDLYLPADQPSILKEIQQEKILSFANSVSLDSYRKTLNLAGDSSWIVTGLGIHPWYAAEQIDSLHEVENLLPDAPFLGEIGLDFLWVEDRSTDPLQREVFDFFLSAAQKYDKWVNLHTKAAEEEILTRLAEYQIKKAIVHWYSGPLDVFREMISRGYMFTIGVAVLHDKLIQQLAAELPLNQLLTETDGGSGLAWFTGESGRPGHIKEVVQMIGQLKGIPAESVRQAVWQNGARLIKDFAQELKNE
ncbi:MAG: TatD family hydrolase [Ardenticatenaceae bacterium]|nr:TatD family hydrolase [Ardenticatenaceae bacterium]